MILNGEEVTLTGTLVVGDIRVEEDRYVGQVSQDDEETPVEVSWDLELEER